MKKVWDRMGIALSAACAVHCILVAFIPLLFPAIASFTHSTWVHIIVAAFVLLVFPLAFIPGYKKHGITWILKIAIIGLALMFIGIFLEGHVPDQVSHSVSILGSVLLVIAHVKNIIHAHRHHSHPCC